MTKKGENIVNCYLKERRKKTKKKQKKKEGRGRQKDERKERKAERKEWGGGKEGKVIKKKRCSCVF